MTRSTQRPIIREGNSNPGLGRRVGAMNFDRLTVFNRGNDRERENRKETYADANVGRIVG